MDSQDAGPVARLLMESGHLFGRYRLEERLGAGGLAEVWRATDTATGATVALKRFSGALASVDSDRLRADVELLAAHALNGHAHVVEVYGGGPEPAPHVVMEYMDGGDLGRELSSGSPLSVERTVEIGIAVASALSSASEAGVIHGDVKPSNVLLGSDGAIKLGDFNVARVLGYTGSSVSGTLMLSFTYAAPEVWDGRQSGASDLYALGCVLYECLTGKPPFTGSHTEVFRAHLERAPDTDALPAQTPPDLRTLIGELLAKDAGRRPADARTVVDRLTAIRPQLEAQPGAQVPTAFGPWLIEAPHPTTPWAWRARHNESGQTATVELFFGDRELGDQLRRAVAVNAQLVPLGAERLLDTNRLLLRPGEGLDRPTPPGWIFWVARQEMPLPAPPPTLDDAALAASVDQLRLLLAAAAGVGIALELSGDNLALLSDGTVHVRRPGLGSGSVDPDASALAVLRERASPAVAPVVAGAATLAALSTALSAAFPGAAAAGGVRPPLEATGLPSMDPPTAVVPRPTAGAGAADEGYAPAATSRAAAYAPVAATPPRPAAGITRETRVRRSGGGAGIVAVLLLVLGSILALIAFMAFGGRNGPVTTLPGIAVGTTSPSPVIGPVVLPTDVPLPTLPPIPTDQPPIPTDEWPPPPAPTPQPEPEPEPEPEPPPDPTPPPPAPIAWSVDIDASQQTAQNGERVNITATANRNVRTSPYYLQVYNPDTGFIHWSCAAGTTCGGGARRENITAPYQARISNASGGDVQAVSQRIEVTWSGGSGNDADPGWSVSMSTSQRTADNGERVTITATSNRSVSGTPWYIQVFNPDTGFVHWSCGAGTTCGGGARRQNITTTYQARVSAADGSSVQAQSERVTVTWR